METANSLFTGSLLLLISLVIWIFISMQKSPLHALLMSDDEDEIFSVCITLVAAFGSWLLFYNLHPTDEWKSGLTVVYVMLFALTYLFSASLSTPKKITH